MKDLKKEAEKILKDNGIDLDKVKIRYSRIEKDDCIRCYANYYTAHRTRQAPALTEFDLQFDSMKDAFVKKVEQELIRYYKK